VAGVPEITTAITHLRDVLGGQTYELLAHKGETMTTAAMVAYFYASGLINAGCDVVTVQRALGHANASVTLGTYSHLWPNADDRTRKAAAAMFDSAYVMRTVEAK
jgi:integrase